MFTRVDKDDGFVESILLPLAIAQNEVGTVRSVLEYELEKSWTTFFRVIKDNDIKLAKLYLECGYDVNARNSDKLTPLDIACENLHTEMIALLLDHGANFKPNPNLHAASPVSLLATKVFSLYKEEKIYSKDKLHEKLFQIMKIFFEHGFSFDQTKCDDRWLVEDIISHGSPELIQLFAERKYKLNCPGRYTSILHIMVRVGNHGAIEEILRYIHIDKTSEYGTALHIAALHGQDLCAKVLIKNGCNVDARMGKYKTPMFIAFTSDHAGSEDVFRRILYAKRTKVSVVQNIHYILKYLNKNQSLVYRNTGAKLLILAEYLTKLDVLKRYILKWWILPFLNKNVFVSHALLGTDFKTKCSKELVQIKKFMNFAGYTLLDLLKKEDAHNAWFINEHVVEFFESGAYEVQFPLYRELLYIGYTEATYRKDLLLKSEPIIMSVGPLSGMPVIVKRIILNHFSNADLLIVLRA